MFGGSWQGFIGTTLPIVNSISPSLLLAFFLFQLAFCGTAATIVSGAVAERISFTGYIITTLVIVCLVYPVTGHWIWGGNLTGNTVGWLEVMGFIDFAGSTGVHGVGGWVALAVILIIGPRRGRFSSKRPAIQGHDHVLAVIGVFLICLGWFGFNGGNAFSEAELAPKLFLNTLLSALAGGLSSLIVNSLMHGYADLKSMMFAMLAGLVSVTAGVHLYTPEMAILCGLVGGLVAFFSEKLLIRLKIDDVVGAVSVHALAGVWGTLAIPLITSPSQWGSGLERWQQMQVQLTGVISVALYSFFVSLLVLGIIHYFYPLRVSGKTERNGLNMAEHNITTEADELIIGINQQRKKRNYKKRLNINPFTQLGQIAMAYNRLLQQIEKEQNCLYSTQQSLEQSNAEVKSVIQQTIDNHRELQSKHKEMQIFSELMADRECRMIELKSEINRLSLQLGEPLPYDPSSLVVKKEDQLE